MTNNWPYLRRESTQGPVYDPPREMIAEDIGLRLKSEVDAEFLWEWWRAHADPPYTFWLGAEAETANA